MTTGLLKLLLPLRIKEVEVAALVQKSICTHAFLAYQNQFGFSWTEGNQTLDIDFTHPGNNLSIALPDGVQMDARSAIESLEMGFIPNASQTSFIKQDEPDLQLDFAQTRALCPAQTDRVWGTPTRYAD